nr:VanW family protein [Chloroflexia bacterium]
LGLFAFRSVYSDRIYPAVTVGDVPVGGLTTGEAENRLVERAADLEQGTIAFSYGGKVWTPSLAELGVSFDLDRSLANARALGRDDDARSRLAFTADLLREDQRVGLLSVVDENTLNTWFDKVDGDIANPAIDAKVQLSGTQVSIVPETTGTVVDRNAATATIMSSLTSLAPSSLDLPTVIDRPVIFAADLEQVRSDVQDAVSGPVPVAFEANTWSIEAETLVQFLTVETVLEGDSPVAKLTFNQEALAAGLRDRFTPEVDRAPTNAQVAWSDDQGVIATEPSVTGITMMVPEFAAAVSQSFLNGHPNVDIPVVETRPEIDSANLAALKIDTLLATGDSNFAGGSAERDINIGVGTGLLNGTLVRPGEEFSFNGAIGEITADKGYVEAGVVVAERSGKEIGGGICQVSTTVFRAAILAGMPITTWNPHTYRLKGYEADGWGPGYDASILQYGSTPEEWGDFKFENATSGWLLVEAWTEYPRMFVRIYGENLGHTVEIVDEWQSDPITDNEDLEIVDESLGPGTIQQIEYPLDGLEVGFTRVVKDASGAEVYNRAFVTKFKGRGNVFEVSPDMKGQAVTPSEDAEE